MVSFVANLLAILSILALAAAVALLVYWLVRRRGSGLGGSTADGTADRAWLWPAWIVAATAMGGSLFFSEIAHFVPCQLCWYQRIGMYPLVFLLALAGWRNERGIRPYVLTLSVIGAAISVYHVFVQRIPGLPSGSCSLDAPCTAIYVEVFGFVTIPFMAFSAFALIIALMLAGPMLAGRTSADPS